MLWGFLPIHCSKACRSLAAGAVIRENRYFYASHGQAWSYNYPASSFNGRPVDPASADESTKHAPRPNVYAGRNSMMTDEGKAGLKGALADHRPVAVLVVARGSPPPCYSWDDVPPTFGTRVQDDANRTQTGGTSYFRTHYDCGGLR